MAAGPTRPPDRPRRLGHPRRSRPQRDRAGAHAGLRRAAGALSARAAHRVGRGGRPAGRPDGQLRSRPHEHGRRPGRLPGPHAHRQEHPRRRAVRERRARGRDGPVRRRAGTRSTSSGSCPTAACTAISGISTRSSRWRRGGSVRARLRARDHRRTRRVADRRPRATCRSSKRSCAQAGTGRIATSSGATTRWTATSAGTARSWPTTRWCTGRRETPPRPRSAAGSGARTRPASPTSSSSRS